MGARENEIAAAETRKTTLPTGADADKREVSEAREKSSAKFEAETREVLDKTLTSR